MTSPLSYDRLRELLEAATPGPWAYRPDKHDDWGFIRGPEVDSSIGRIRPPVALAREGYPFSTSEQDDAHRLAGTDPYAANAALIVAAVNALPDLLTRIADLEGALRELEDANQEVCAGRSHTAYLAMVDGGQSDALSRLDNARRDARAALRALSGTDTGEKVGG